MDKVDAMKTKAMLIGAVLASRLFGAYAVDSAAAPKETAFATRPLGIKVSVKMVGPYMQAANLQIICAFKHKLSGDVYLAPQKSLTGKWRGFFRPCEIAANSLVNSARRFCSYHPKARFRPNACW